MRRLCAALLLVAACTDRPALTTGGETTTGTSTSTSTSTSPTTGATSPTTSTTDVASTTDVVSTSSASSTTTTGGTTDNTSSTTDVIPGPASECGPPCAETWELPSDLVIGPDPADFSCLTRVHGDLRAWGDANPATIATLANLVRVDGSLHLAQQTGLNDLTALACLREVDWLRLEGMPQIVELAPLAGLRVAPAVLLQDLGITTLPTFAPDYAGIQALTLVDLPALVDLGPATSWPYAGGGLFLNLVTNSGLTSIADLAGLIAAADPALSWVQLHDLASLTSLAGLEPMTHVESLSLTDLPQLTDLAPLAGLTSGSLITLGDLPGITDLAGLGALTHVDSLSLGECSNDGMDGLTSLAGLDSLTSVGALTLRKNDNLTSLAGAPALTSVTTFDFAANESPLLSQAELDAFIAQLDVPPMPPRPYLCPQ